MSNRQILEDFMVRGSEELFAAYGVQVARVDRAPASSADEPVAFAGIIGFTGNDARGTLVLAPSQRLLKSSQPTADGHDRDWVGELANQLLGRVKNQLLSCGVEIHMTTPVVIKGQHLSPVPREELQPLWFVGDGVQLAVWLDIELTAGKRLEIGESSTPGEGEAFLF